VLAAGAAERAVEHVARQLKAITSHTLDTARAVFTNPTDLADDQAVTLRDAPRSGLKPVLACEVTPLCPSCV